MQFLYFKNTKDVFTLNLETDCFILSGYEAKITEDYEANCYDWDRITDEEKEIIQGIGFVGIETKIELYNYNKGIKFLTRVGIIEGSSLWGIQADADEYIQEEISNSKKDLLKTLSKLGFSDATINLI